MDLIIGLLDFIVHIDRHLDTVMQSYGQWTYAVLFVIVFCETGLVVTPFLPGDSLLFAAGALSARAGLDVNLMALSILVAAILGDAVNYSIGAWVGPRVFDQRYQRIFRPSYLERTQRFYDKYGGKTIIIARFVPIVRTFAPFLAGVGSMSYPRFALYNVTGALLWVALVLYAGYFFGEIPVIKQNFGLVVIGIIIVSVLPVVLEFWRAKRATRNV